MGLGETPHKKNFWAFPNPGRWLGKRLDFMLSYKQKTSDNRDNNKQDIRKRVLFLLFPSQVRGNPISESLWKVFYRHTSSPPPSSCIGYQLFSLAVWWIRVNTLSQQDSNSVIDTTSGTHCYPKRISNSKQSFQKTKKTEQNERANEETNKQQTDELASIPQLLQKKKFSRQLLLSRHIHLFSSNKSGRLIIQFTTGLCTKL